MNPEKDEIVDKFLNKSLLKKSFTLTSINIVDGIPVFLDDETINQSNTSSIHKVFDSEFSYRDHYEKDAVYFDYFEEPADGATAHETKRLHQTILARVPATAKTILDVGCGGAWVAKALADKEVTIISMDLAHSNVKKATTLVPGKNHSGLVADVFDMPFADNSIDCVICAEVIEHVNDPAKLIESIGRILRPGGVAIITTPYDEKIAYSLCVHCNCNTPHNAHLHSFDERSILSFVPKNLSAKTLVFSNKLLAKIKSHLFLSWLPYSIWTRVDKIASAMSKGRFRLLVEVTK